MSDSKGKDSLMKMLLSSGPSAGSNPVSLPPPPPPPPPGPPRYSTPTSSIPSPASDIAEENCPTLGMYLNQVGIAGQNTGFGLWNKIYLDHNYAKPGSESYNHGYMKPTKTLFIAKTLAILSSDDIIDVDTDQPQPKPPYDLSRAQECMEECEKYISSNRNVENEPDDWEESLSKTGWSTPQTNIFNKVVKILHSDRLSRLANSGCRNEPVLRRIVIDKSAQRFRDVMSSVMWDIKLIRWLHSLLVENLNTSYLSSYTEILQTLRNEIPTLIDKMMGSNNQIVKGNEGANPLLKAPWDPVGASIAQHKLKKLPGNPVILLVPCKDKNQTVSQRAKFWQSHLSDLATVVTVSPSSYNIGTKLTTQAYLAQLVTATKGRLAEVRVEYPRRPIILMGWRSAAALACQVAVTEPVSAVVCLGFASNTVEGHRGEPDDFLLDVRCPVLFVIGENAAATRQEDVEEIREKMRYQTDLLVVGYADDYLRMSKSKKRMEGVTQSMVDRCILEEIGDFLAGVLISPKPVIMATDFRREIYGRRRHNSTTSSVDSESSAAKRSRPGTPQSQVPMGSGAALKALSVSQVNGNLKVSPVKPLPRGRRPGSGKKVSKLLMNSTLQTNSINQVNNSNGGITVNIGSLASLGPIGPLRMGGNGGGSSSSSSNNNINNSNNNNSNNNMNNSSNSNNNNNNNNKNSSISSSNISSSSNNNSINNNPNNMNSNNNSNSNSNNVGISSAAPSNKSNVKSPHAVVEAAPPEVVMPIRDVTEDIQEIKSGSPQGKQVLTKGITRLLIGPFNSNNVGNVVQTVPVKSRSGTIATGTRLSLPPRTNAKDDRKSVTSVRYVIASNSRLNTFLYPARRRPQWSAAASTHSNQRTLNK